ncbi:MAG: NADH-quinone oxidoreductase subunit N [Acidimicrobiales bacterium]|jgi:NADH-quinone oxidoreductase subunit N
MSLFALLAPIPSVHIDYTAILPELIFIGGALVLLLAGALRVRQIPTVLYTAATVVISVASLVSSIVLWRTVAVHGPFGAISDSLTIDGFSVAFMILASCILVVAASVADGYLRREGIVGPEYYALALLAASGAMLMASANDLIVIFLGLEIMSIPLYILAGFDQRRAESGEAAMKYFVLGAFSSAIFVYGIALTYGATGSTNLAEIASYLANNLITSNGLLLAGLALLLAGFAFKVAAVPFHMWTPDVYQGAPTPATGFMAAIAKVGGFAALLRVFFSTFHSLAVDWQPILWAIAIVTLLVGAVLGLVQRDIKRMLAYSSINHAGFILLGLQAATASGIASSLYYVFVYAFLVLGSFTVIAVVGGTGDRDHSLEDYRGLGRRQPVLALCFAILLLAQAGAPFTTGFLAKLYVVESAVQAHSYALAVIAMLSGAVAAAFYLRVVFLMYGSGGAVVETQAGGVPEVDLAAPEAAGTAPAGALAVAVADPATATVAVTAPGFGLARLPIPLGSQIGLFLTVGFTLVFGIWPGPLFSFVHAASLAF